MTLDDIAFALERRIDYNAKAHLLDVFGTAEAVYAAPAAELEQKAELNPILARGLPEKRTHRLAEQELTFMRKHGIAAVASTDPQYPALLRECNDYPHVLYVKGDPAALSAPTLSMVGTRKVNAYGVAVCNRLVGDLGRLKPELTVVSGLAFGVDVACHRAALDAGLRTVAVLANALDGVYPSAHAGVANDMIARGGALVSELSSQDNPSKLRFLQRNRIIAGMSRGTVVVQSPAGGGSMITAGHVDGYNRCLMAPPSALGDPMGEGTNLLLRNERAHVVLSGADILAELNWEPTAPDALPTAAPVRPEGEVHGAVYDCICTGGSLATEQIELRTGIAAQKLMEVLLDLECDGFIRQRGARYERFRI